MRSNIRKVVLALVVIGALVAAGYYIFVGRSEAQAGQLTGSGTIEATEITPGRMRCARSVSPTGHRSQCPRHAEVQSARKAAGSDPPGAPVRRVHRHSPSVPPPR